ncbi:MAG: BolA/IbaG family iron-sulfur metabolism protein [Candidatus Mycalebacterium zealandia]|nr:MAG: BolA/IbaG family iron-sulfur metabolism protein [Candidatus Mycalebacterium zealandia]
MIPPVSPESIKETIEKSIAATHVEVDGDGTHFEAVVVSGDFEGKSPVDRHKLVYSALGDAMKEEIHALSIKTYTPEQWGGEKNGG